MKENQGDMNWLQGQLFRERLDSPFGYVVLTTLSLAFAFLVVKFGPVAGVLLIGAILAIPIALSALTNLKIGTMLLIFFSFFVLAIKKIDGNIPMGLAMDATIFLMFIGVCIKQIMVRDWSFAKNPISTMVLIWIGYNLFEFFNPDAASRMAWVYTVRSMAGVLIFYFIILYTIKDDFEFLKRLIYIWMAIAFLAALYGAWQEFMGLADYEMNWINRNVNRKQLYFQGGRWRKFSFLSDPMMFGIVMSYTSVFAIVLAMGGVAKKKSIMLWIVGIACGISMNYAGTRTAMAILPLGFAFFAFITFRKWVVMFAIVVAMGLVSLFFLPTINTYHYRFKTAFDLNDASYQVRAKNQSRIQTFIQENPMGGGLGSTGVWGRRFSPDHFLSSFPPDSGFVRIAVEQGWLGLFIYCTFLFVTFWVGVRNCFASRDPIIKSYYYAFLSFLFTLVVANFPQEAMTQYPTNILFSICLAAFVKLKDFQRPEFMEDAELTSTNSTHNF